MTIDKNLLGNKRKALNTLAQAIDVNVEAASTVTVADADGRYTGTNVETCLAEIAGAGRTSETVKDNADNIEDVTDSLGLGTFATGTVTFSVSAGELSVTSRICGTDGNGWTITPIAIVGSEGDVTVDEGAKTIEVEVTDATTTDDKMAQYINEHYLANKIVSVTSGSAGEVDVDEVLTMASGTDTDAFIADDNSLLTSAAFTASGKPETLYGATQLLSDGANLINQRDILFPVHKEHILKHRPCAVATYDFDVHGGAISTIDLTDDVLPANAIITGDVIIDVVEALVTTDTSGTVTFIAETDGDLSEAIADTAADLIAGKPGNFALDGNALSAANMGIARAATWVKTTEARKIQIKIETKAVTAGKIDIIVPYYVTEATV